jgi:hypothetical protein
VRHERPVYVDLLPPCNAGCPAGENIQGWMAHVKVGEHAQASVILALGQESDTDFLRAVPGVEFETNVPAT